MKKREYRARDLFIPDVSKSDIENLMDLYHLAKLIFSNDPAWQSFFNRAIKTIEKIERAWMAKERTHRKNIETKGEYGKDSYDELGTTNFYTHPVKEVCPACGGSGICSKCNGRGWIINIESEKKAIEMEKRRLGLK